MHDGFSQGQGPNRAYSVPAKVPFIRMASNTYNKYTDIEKALGIELYPVQCGDTYSNSHYRQNEHKSRSADQRINYYWLGSSWAQEYAEDHSGLCLWKDTWGFDSMIKEMHKRGWSRYVQMQNDGSHEIVQLSPSDWGKYNLSAPTSQEWETPPPVRWKDLEDTTPITMKHLSSREIADLYAYDCRFFNFEDFGYFDCADKKWTVHFRHLVHGKKEFMEALEGWNQKSKEFAWHGCYQKLLCGDEFKEGTPDPHGNFQREQYVYYRRPDHYVDNVDQFERASL